MHMIMVAPFPSSVGHPSFARSPPVPPPDQPLDGRGTCERAYEQGCVGSLLLGTRIATSSTAPEVYTGEVPPHTFWVVEVSVPRHAEVEADFVCYRGEIWANVPMGSTERHDA